MPTSDGSPSPRPAQAGPPRSHDPFRARAALVGAVVALVALTSACTGGHTPDGARTAGGPPAATIGPWNGVSATTGTAAPTAGATSGTTTGDPAGTAASGTSTGTGGREGDPEAPAGPAALPLGSTTPAPQLTRPLPESGSARGSLVTGFPTAIVPVPDGATIISSSVAAQADRLQVGLEASTSSSTAEVLAHYLEALIGEGFSPTESPATLGATATAFTRGAEGLVLTVRDRMGGGTELSVAGTLVATG